MKSTAAARPKSPVRRRRTVIAAACAAFALLAGLGARFWLDRRTPPPDADAARLARYMATPAFAALPDARRAPYLDAFRRAGERGELTPEQQRGVITNLVNQIRKDPIRHYFSLPPGPERSRILDDVIDRVLRTEKDGKGPPPPDKGAAKGDGIGHLADAIPPEDRARMGQFLQELHDRRVERGLPDDGKFLFARPG
jgi:hypothetical protein